MWKTGSKNIKRELKIHICRAYFSLAFLILFLNEMKHRHSILKDLSYFYE